MNTQTANIGPGVINKTIALCLLLAMGIAGAYASDDYTNCQRLQKACTGGYA